jgi:hypothetical protein
VTLPTPGPRHYASGIFRALIGAQAAANSGLAFGPFAGPHRSRCCETILSSAASALLTDGLPGNTTHPETPGVSRERTASHRPRRASPPAAAPTATAASTHAIRGVENVLLLLGLGAASGGEFLAAALALAGLKAWPAQSGEPSLLMRAANFAKSSLTSLHSARRRAACGEQAMRSARAGRAPPDCGTRAAGGAGPGLLFPSMAPVEEFWKLTRHGDRCAPNAQKRCCSLEQRRRRRGRWSAELRHGSCAARAR